MSTNELSPAHQQIAAYQKKFATASRRWRLWSRALLVASAFFSTAASVVGQFDFDGVSERDVASVLAGLATLVTTVIASISFEANWSRNRRSRAAVDAIALEAKKSTADPDQLLTHLQEVLRRHAGHAGQDG